MAKLEENSVTDMMDRGIDLAPRWEKILKHIASEASFVPDEKLLRKSEWWKTGKIGAVHCPGILKADGSEKRAVLKIQGTRPPTSEVEMIKAFEAQNKSKVIRPPQIFYHSPWDDEKQYEAFIMEEVDGLTVIVNHPATEKELADYFRLYEEYKSKCVNVAWVVRPESFSYRKQVEKWMGATEGERENDSSKDKGDMELAERGIQILEGRIKLRDLEFMHGHFQPGDLVVAKSGEVVLFSNLFWSWRIPFYDAVFGYHWWMLGMEHAENFTEELLEKERSRWLGKILDLSEVKNHKRGEELINLALLERAIPALMVDRYFMDRTKPSFEVITKAARRELKRLIKWLS